MTSRTFLLTLLASVAVAACSDHDTPQPETPPQAPDRALAVASNGFQEATVTTGAAAAEFGNAQSGVVAIEARNSQASRDSATIPAMLIRTGSTVIRVDSLEIAITELQALTRRLGGYVGNTSYTGGQERRRQASIQLRIPASRFDALQAEVAGIGTVLSFQVQASDVGMQYTDAQARLRSKRQVEQRLLQLLATRTGKLSDVVELEEAMSEVREGIEQAEGEIRYYRNQVALSTVDVTLMEPGLVVAEPGHHPIRDSFGRAWRNFTGFIAGIIASLGWVLPLGVMAFAVIRIARWAWVKRMA